MSDVRFLYIIGYDKEGPVKIGISNKPERRLKQLQTGQDKQLVLFHVEEAVAKHAPVLERFVHAQIAHRRRSGEWFDICLEDAIAELKFSIIRWASDPELDAIIRRRRR